MLWTRNPESLAEDQGSITAKIGMNDDSKSTLVLAAIALAFLALAGAFQAQLWGRPEPLTQWPLVDPAFTNTATVRMSAAEVIKSGGDASGLACYACHEKGKPPKVVMDDKRKIKLPEEHNDLVMLHGRNSRNIHCFNCHDPEKLDSLKTRDGRSLKWEESTLLCASCHGPTYRDWEIGIHGRTSGYWDRSKGPTEKVQCASCHHPHSPAFTKLPPAPAPHRLHDKPGAQPHGHEAADGEKEGKENKEGDAKASEEKKEQSAEKTETPAKEAKPETKEAPKEPAAKETKEGEPK